MILPIVAFYWVFYLISGKAVQENSILVYTEFSGFLIVRFLQAAVYGLVCFHILISRRELLNYPLLVQYFLIVYFAMYWGLRISSTHFLIWFIPFLICFILQYPQWKKAYYFLLLLIFLEGLRARNAFLGIFEPINPEFFMSFPSLMDVTGFLFDQEIYDMIIVSSFKGLTAVWVLFILKALYRPQIKYPE